MAIAAPSSSSSILYKKKENTEKKNNKSRGEFGLGTRRKQQVTKGAEEALMLDEVLAR